MRLEFTRVCVCVCVSLLYTNILLPFVYGLLFICVKILTLKWHVLLSEKMFTCMYVNIYSVSVSLISISIYIYREREREKEWESDTLLKTTVFCFSILQICISAHVCVCNCKNVFTLTQYIWIKFISISTFLHANISIHTYLYDVCVRLRLYLHFCACVKKINRFCSRENRKFITTSFVSCGKSKVCKRCEMPIFQKRNKKWKKNVEPGTKDWKDIKSKNELKTKNNWNSQFCVLLVGRFVYDSFYVWQNMSSRDRDWNAELDHMTHDTFLFWIITRLVLGKRKATLRY